MGDAIATNMFMLGYAYQKGWVPLAGDRSSVRSS
jgi:indolepyruvate ferredoxin oxidoreductase